jgi:lipid-A-disaccharide synthase-like uncharacterized protein
MSMELGIIGTALVVLAWVWETVDAVKRHRSLIDLKFAVINFGGTVVLIAYALSIGDPVFIILNSLISLAILAEITYSIIVRKVHRHR